MPIMAIYRNREVDPETFNRFRALVPVDPPPEGAIFHLVAFGDDGLLGIDVWDNEQHLTVFEETQVKPALRSLGMEGLDRTVLQVHELLAVDNATAHNLYAREPQPESTLN